MSALPASERGTRYWRRRTNRHLWIASACGAIGWAVYVSVDSDDGLFRLSMATAYAAMAMVVLSLVLGPLKVLRSVPSPVSTDLRRDVGIWAAVLGLAHVVVGLQVHLRGQMWTYFVFPADTGRGGLPRYDLFGIANYTGLAAAMVLAGLLALSNDLSLRRLGAPRWKALQRWNYVGFALVAVHGAAYQWIEDRALLFIAIFGALMMVAVALQAAGRRRVQRGARLRVTSLHGSGRG